LPNTTALEAEIFNDLDVERHGVGWWSGGLDSKRRILVGDYLQLCAGGLNTNLIEAAVHLLEARGGAEAIERRLVGAVRVSRHTGVHSIDFPPSSCPHDDLQGVAVQMNVVGCVRALASTLDCLGAVVVGVLGLRTGIFRTKYLNTIDRLEKLEREDGIQGQAARHIIASMGRAGPAGWDRWLLEYRNMLVHRGRHLWMTKLVNKDVPLHVPGGDVVLPHAMVPMLPRDPGRSEVEVLRDASEKGFLLTESAWTTLEAVKESTVSLCEDASGALISAWKARRESPEQLPQPKEQWPEVGPGRVAQFGGYAPGSVPFDPSEFRASLGFPRRLRAAYLADRDRERWGLLDG
jgi:hypothetical protein